MLTIFRSSNKPCDIFKEIVILTLLSIRFINISEIATTKEYLGRHEIIAQILRTANEIDHAQLKEYRSFLVESGLLEELHLQSRTHNKKSIYKITQKGLRFLHVVNEIKSLTSPENIS
jgi:predicted transcriptional regulator